MNDPQKLSVATTVHGVVLVRPPRPEGEEEGGPAPLLVGFHGYGENAERHLAELVKIPGTEGWLVAAVQALHPFYTRGNEVVASWMTSFDREHAIADNAAYAGAAVDRLREWAPAEPQGPLVFAGVSQGVAMAYRAAARSGHAARGVIALGGDVPPELTDRHLARIPRVLVGGGRAETFYTPAKLEADVARLRKAGVDVRPFPYD